MSRYPGSKRKFPRLPVVTDTQGNRHVIWPERKRKGRQAAPMTAEAREAGYRERNGERKDLTPAQRRRLDAKRNHALSREAA